MWNKKTILLLGLILLLGIAETQAVGSVTLVTGTIVKTKYGQLTVVKNMVMASMAAYANGTILFNVTGYENTQHVYQFNLRAYGNGTWNIRFWGIIPIQVTANSATSISYNYPYEQIQYTTSQNTPLIVVYGANPQESQKVLFIDDFLYTNPLAESSWTIDRYTINVNPGTSTGSGYLTMTAQTTSTIETVHVTSPAYDPAIQTDGIIVKRKLTISLIPFAKNETNTATIRAGTFQLLTSGAFPGTGPYGTPFVDINNNCVSNGGSTDNVGASYLAMGNDGTTTAVACGDGTNNRQVLETANPTRYTVFTIVTSAVYCGTCLNKMQAGTAWTWFRIYQRDSSGNLLPSTDKTLNVTSGVAPLSRTAYLTISQINNNGAATGQISKIDLVQLQNYGSPVCLSVPRGILCTQLPIIPNNLGQGLISDIAWLANQIGFGDEQIGAIIMFLVFSTGFAFIPFILTRNYLIAGTGLLIVFTFFIYAGFLPTWMLIFPILFGGVLGVLLVNRLLGSHSLMGGGGGSADG